jgi:protein NirF
MISRRALLASSLLTTGAAAASVAGPVQAQNPPVPLRATGDLGVIVERAKGALTLVERSGRSIIGRVEGLGDLSHASAVFSRDERFVFVFGRDGGLTKVDLLTQSVAARVVQAGNSIGGAISDDGRLVAVANYEPGGVRVFDADTLEPVADVPAAYGDGTARAKVVGLEDSPGRLFTFSLYEADEIRLLDLSDVKAPKVTRFPGAGRLPYDALVTPDGRYYVAGLFGEDGMTMLDLWRPEQGLRRVLPGYGRGQEPLPVYKMPHLEGWGFADGKLYLPAVGRHEVLVVDATTWAEAGRIPVAGQPVFVMARPDGRHVWVNFALPDNGKVQVIDVLTHKIVADLAPGPAVLHMEFAPRGEEVWMSVRDADKVKVFDTRTFKEIAALPVDKPSGIFFTSRAHRIGL